MATDEHEQARSSGREDPVRGGSPERGATRPVIFAVDAGAESFARIELGLRRRYGNDFRVICETSAMWGLKRLRDMRAADEEVVLILRSEEHTSELQSRQYLVCRLLLEKKNIVTHTPIPTLTYV